MTDPFAPPPAGQNPPPSQGAPYGAPDYPQGQQQWGAPPPYGSPLPRASKNGLGIAALVLGILSILTFFTVFGGVLFGLLAIVLGLVGRSRAKRGEATNGGVALTGVILGALGLVGTAVFLVAIFAFGGDLISCLEDAGDDQAAVEQCQRDFTDQLTN